jgi:hypothetical protein
LLLIKGNAKNAMAPKVTIMSVWQVHMIHPKAKLDSLEIPKAIKTSDTE